MDIVEDKDRTHEGITGADLLGLKPGLVVQELGWDEDVDADLRDDIMDIIDADMIEDPLDSVDVTVLWWRDDDGDVADGLVDAITDLGEDGYIWLLTPKVGRPGFVEAASVAEAVTIAGLSMTSTVNIAPEWQGTKVVRPKAGRR